MYSLANRYPAALTTLPRRALTVLPTPIEPAAKLGAALDLAELSIKRDDVTAILYGGNKVRKLEYLLADAQLQDCDTVITFGAVGSNHALATAIYARHLGFDCAAVLTDQPATPLVAKTLRYHALLGTRLLHAHDYRSPAGIADEFAKAHAGGSERVYKIPWGGSAWLGTVGFVNAALELCEQCPMQPPDVVYVACGTMGTAVGLALGFRLATCATRVEAVQVAPEPVTTHERFSALYWETNSRLMALDDRVPEINDPWQNVSLRAEFLGPGYAETTPECIDAVNRIADTEGLHLETTYTGKALAALLADAAAGKLRDRRVLFWNTYNSRPVPPEIDDIEISTIPESLRRYLA